MAPSGGPGDPAQHGNDVGLGVPDRQDTPAGEAEPPVGEGAPPEGRAALKLRKEIKEDGTVSSSSSSEKGDETEKEEAEPSAEQAVDEVAATEDPMEVDPLGVDFGPST
eukprot:3883946-Amphidinium_carterae.2